MDGTKSLLCCVKVTFLLFYTAGFADGRAGGKSGSSGGTSGGGSRSSYGSSRGGTSYYNSRGGSKYFSSYVQYNPGVRNIRAYSTQYLGSYSYYYSQYFLYSSTYNAVRRNYQGNDIAVCVNYEGNENGTVMGVFTCPLEFEPANFTACCGYQYTEYCCEPNYNSQAGAWILLLVVFSLIGIFLITLCLCQHNKFKWVEKSVTRRRISRIVTLSSHTVEPVLTTQNGQSQVSNEGSSTTQPPSHPHQAPSHQPIERPVSRPSLSSYYRHKAESTK